ncbi:hypothetical protein OH76DRAFT_264314 [Lentinus brumalis]|uniref:Uncharacterized protein n=1 Tax=Lentinus brumalis TaxID=2498619 RepID=A0A371DGL6_9APHY|nr:hypothetical protein OH76DRAFT_264314 [Polyporus brumalis]
MVDTKCRLQMTQQRHPRRPSRLRAPEGHGELAEDVRLGKGDMYPERHNALPRILVHQAAASALLPCHPQDTSSPIACPSLASPPRPPQLPSDLAITSGCVAAYGVWEVPRPMSSRNRLSFLAPALEAARSVTAVCLSDGPRWCQHSITGPGHAPAPCVLTYRCPGRTGTRSLAPACLRNTVASSPNGDHQGHASGTGAAAVRRTLMGVMVQPSTNRCEVRGTTSGRVTAYLRDAPMAAGR